MYSKNKVPIRYVITEILPPPHIGGNLFAFLGMFFEARMFPTLAKSASLSSYHLNFCCYI